MRGLCLAVALILCATGAWANARMTILMDVLQIDAVVEILRTEGLVYAQDLDADMLDGQGGAFWARQVQDIYDATRIKENVRQALEQGLSPAQIEAALAFFGTDAGQQIVTLENAARRAMSDPEVEQTARDIFAASESETDPLFRKVLRYIVINDLLERNVTGSMTANFQFFQGLSDGRYLVQSEEEILRDVWSQQDDIRTDTEAWLTGFLLLAYQPLSPEVMDDYLAYSSSADGQALNAALFDGFERIYRDISYALGRAVALNASGDEI